MKITRNDKLYNGPLFQDELTKRGVLPNSVRVKTTDDTVGFPNLSVDILVEDDDGSISQVVESVADSHDGSEKSDGERLQEALGIIQDRRSVAQNYAGDVAALYAAVIEADAAADTTQERYDRIRQVMTGADAAFRTRFTQAMETETGIDIGSIGLSNLTIDQTQAVNAFARRFANSLTILLAM